MVILCNKSEWPYFTVIWLPYFDICLCVFRKKSFSQQFLSEKNLKNCISNQFISWYLICVSKIGFGVPQKSTLEILKVETIFCTLQIFCKLVFFLLHSKSNFDLSFFSNYSRHLSKHGTVESSIVSIEIILCLRWSAAINFDIQSFYIFLCLG